MTGRPAVFLDRDGVLNEVVERDGKPGSPRRVDEFRLAVDAVESVARLRAAGLPVFVVTNQPDLARGLLAPAAFAVMSSALMNQVGVDDVAVCPHDDADRCDCRKPRPGMIERLAAEWAVDVRRSYIVGDSWRDVGAGRAAGCRTVLLQTWYNTDVDADAAVGSLAAAVDWILDQEQGDGDVDEGKRADDAH